MIWPVIYGKMGLVVGNRGYYSKASGKKWVAPQT